VLPATAAALWLIFRYLNGHGWPASTSARRKRLLKGRALPLRTWVSALVAGGLGIASAMCIAFVTARVDRVSQHALQGPIDFASLPPLTIWAVVAAIALTAGVVEESAFRGYLVSSIEEQFGWTTAFVVSAPLFFAAHLTHAYASIAFAPFFLAHCAVLTLLVYFTRSVLPSIVIHTISDFIVLPIQYGVIGQQLPASATSYAAAAFVLALASVPAFACLARAGRLTASAPAESTE
jgi:membrane protease YdiL (CAAX protease family)